VQRDVLRTQTPESIPFALSLGNLIVSSLWFAYGSIINDLVITVRHTRAERETLQIPNAIGIGLACIQLSLFVIYPSRQTTHLPLKV